VISIIDDDESVRGASEKLFRSAGYDVATFASAELFLESDALSTTKCLILDIRLRGIDGLELQRRLNSAESRVPIIFVTAHDDKVNQRNAINGGAIGFFRKPFDASALLSSVQTALEHRGERKTGA
jgi:two-component system, LuxR family, response regulator FixJ